MLSVKGVADSPPADGAVKIDLRHVTVLARLGLLQMMATGDVPYLPPVEINVSDSIFLTDPKSPFVLQTADDELSNCAGGSLGKAIERFMKGLPHFGARQTRRTLKIFKQTNGKPSGATGINIRTLARTGNRFCSLKISGPICSD